MEFRSFVRQVGGASSDPLVGSDPVPDGMASKSNTCSISLRIEGKSGVGTIQRLAIAYAGPAATLPCTIYIFDEGSENWIVTGTGDLTGLGLSRIDCVCPLDEGVMNGSIDVYVQVADPGGLANGIYTFLVAGDSSNAVNIATGGGPAVNVAVTNFPATFPSTVISSALPTGAATEVKQDAGNTLLGSIDTELASIDTKTPALGQALAAASVPSVLPAAQETSLRDISDRAARLVGHVTVDASALPSGAATSAAQTDGTQKTQVTVLPSIPTGANTIGAVTAPGAAALALDATLTGGTAKSIVRGGAKGATISADITSTPQGADHQGIDAQVRDTSGNPMPSMDVAARKGFVAITDGTNTQAVKAASTAAQATDPAAVVAFSPNSPLPAGNSLIGSAVQRPASGSADVTTAHNSGAGTLVQKENGVKGAAGNLFSFLAYNSSTSPRWIYVYDALTATGTEIHVLQVPPKDLATGTFGFGSTDFPYGRRFSTGLSWAASTTPPGTAFNAAGSEIYAEMEYV